MSVEIVLDTRTGERGGFDDWVRIFDESWTAPRDNLERILGLLSEDVVLKAPTRPPMSRGRSAGRNAFRAAFSPFPDLTGQTKHGAAAGALTFIHNATTVQVGGLTLSRDHRHRSISRHREDVVPDATIQDSTIVLRTARRSLRGWVQIVRLSLGK